MGKLIVISAPSGAGKTSIVHFLSVEEFQKKIKKGDFLEWEEVYKNQYYGTLKSEVERIWQKGETVIFDVDVVGGVNIKKQYSTECLSIFIMPPSLDVLAERLTRRGSESADSLHKRIAKAKGEIARSGEFDKVILNDDFDMACKETKQLIQTYIG